MILSHRAKMKAINRDEDSLDRILESLEDLRTEISEIAENSQGVNERLDEISGRVDFAERLLSSGKSDFQSRGETPGRP